MTLTGCPLGSPASSARRCSSVRYIGAMRFSLVTTLYYTGNLETSRLTRLSPTPPRRRRPRHRPNTHVQFHVVCRLRGRRRARLRTCGEFFRYCRPSCPLFVMAVLPPLLFLGLYRLLSHDNMRRPG